MHLLTFFELWDVFVLQAVQTEGPRVSDAILFEVRTLSSSLFVYSVYLGSSTVVISGVLIPASSTHTCTHKNTLMLQTDTTFMLNDVISYSALQINGQKMSII